MEILSHINLLCYDIKEKIFNELDILKETEYNKRNYYHPVVNELNMLINDSKNYIGYFSEITFIQFLYSEDRLNNVYRDFNVGSRMYYCENDNDCYIRIKTIYDNQYYNDLDFILDTDRDTIIDIDNRELTHNYKMKEERKYKYEKNYHLITYNNTDLDNYYGLVKDREYSYCFHLLDWLEEENCLNDIHNDLLYNVLEELENERFNSNEKLKHILYTERLNSFNVFYKSLII